MIVGMILGLVWIVGLIGALMFMVAYGSPRKYADGPMSWHLFWTGLSGGLQWLGLLLSRWSLVPLLVADALAVGIVYWRFALLFNTRRRSALKGEE